MLVAFKLGPLLFDDGETGSAYFAVDDERGPLADITAANDLEGLSGLRRELRGERFTCEPELRLAAQRLGLASAPLPDWAVDLRGLVAVGLALEEEAELEPGRLFALAEASAAFQEARPWERWGDDEPLVVQLSGAVQGEREVIVMGPGEFIGLVAYDDPGTTAKLLEATSFEKAERGTRSTALSFSEEPAFAREPVRAAFGLSRVPMLTRREKGKNTVVSEKEGLALVAVLEVVAEAASREGAVERNLEVDGKRVRARLRVPAGVGQRARAMVPPSVPAASVAPEATQMPQQVPEVPRNAPCPCGSGKKYKKCHGLEAAKPSLRPLQPHETDALERRLVQQLSGERRERAHDAYPIPRQDLQVHDLQLFGPWSIYSFRFDGRTELERFLASDGPRLSSREREFLEAQHESPFSILEIEAARQGEGFSLRDVLTGERFEVLERLGSRSAERWMGVLARPVSFGGVTRLYGMHPRPMNPEGLALAERRAREVLGLKPGERTTREWLHQPGKAEALIEAWEEAVYEADNRPLPQFQNTDGELLEPVKLVFQFERADHQAIAAGLEALADSPEQSRGQAIYTFLRSGNRMHPDWENTLVGRAILKDESLELEANSRKRATALRQKVVRKLGKKIRFVSREVEDLREKLEESRHAPPKPRLVPEPQALDAVREVLESHYRSWLDMAVPALEGRTPREAARNPKLHRQLRQLLKQAEASAQRNTPPIDISFLWSELKLSPHD